MIIDCLLYLFLGGGISLLLLVIIGISLSQSLSHCRVQLSECLRQNTNQGIEIRDLHKEITTLRSDIQVLRERLARTEDSLGAMIEIRKAQQ